MTINPAKETDLVIMLISFKIEIWFGIKTWKNIKKNKEVNIVEIILITKSLNESLNISKVLENSIGKNNIKIEIRKNISPQNKASPVQDV